MADQIFTIKTLEDLIGFFKRAKAACDRQCSCNANLSPSSPTALKTRPDHHCSRSLFASHARYRRLCVTGSVYVSIFAPSGHYRLCPHREHDSPLHACPDGHCRTLTFRPRPAMNDSCVEVSASRGSQCPPGFPPAETPSRPKSRKRADVPA